MKKSDLLLNDSIYVICYTSHEAPRFRSLNLKQKNTRYEYTRKNYNHKAYLIDSIGFSVTLKNYETAIFAEVKDAEIMQMYILNFSNLKYINDTNIYSFIDFLEDEFFLDRFKNSSEIRYRLKIINIPDILKDINFDKIVYSFNTLTKNNDINMVISSQIDTNIYQFELELDHDFFNGNLKDALYKYLIKIKSSCVNFKKLLDRVEECKYNISQLFYNFSVFRLASNQDINHANKLLDNIVYNKEVPNEFYERFKNVMWYFDNNSLKKGHKILIKDLGITFMYDPELTSSTRYQYSINCYFVIMGNVLPIDMFNFKKIIEFLYNANKLEELMDKIEFYILKNQ